MTMPKGVATIAAALVIAIASPARAELLGDVLKPFLSVSEIYDSNVFRVKDRKELQDLLERPDGFKEPGKMSDFSTVVSFGTDIHYELSKQKVDVSLLHDIMRYSRYSSLDTDRDLAKGTLSLSLLDKFRLKVDGSYEDYPQPRADFRSNRLNKVTRWSAGGTAAYEAASGVGLEVGYLRTEVGYSLEDYREREYTMDGYKANLTYRLSPMTKIYAGYNREEIDYLHSEPGENFSNDADSLRVGVEIAKAAKTTLSGYVGYVRRTHLHQEDRDFDGVIGRLAATYQATPKITIMLDWQRQVYEETYIEWIYSVTNAIGSALAYQVTPRIKVTATGRVQWKDFKGAFHEDRGPDNDVLFDSRPRNEVIYEAGANLEWEVYRRLILALWYGYSARSSNLTEYEFADHTVSATLTYRF